MALPDSSNLSISLVGLLKFPNVCGYSSIGNPKSLAVIAAPIEINGEKFVCQVVIHKNLNENKFYLHEVSSQKNLSNDAFVTNLAQKPASIGEIAKVLQDIVTAKEKSSKIVDENGEPLVVYYGNRKR